MTSGGEHMRMTVRTNLHALHGEDYSYVGELPVPGDLIVAESTGGPVNVRVTEVVEDGGSYRVEGVEPG